MSEDYSGGGEGEEPTRTFLDNLCVTVAADSCRASAAAAATSSVAGGGKDNDYYRRPEREASRPLTPPRSRSFISAVFGQDTHNNVTNLLATVTDVIDGALDNRAERERQKAAAREETRRMEEAMSRAAARAASEGGDVSTYNGESDLDDDNGDNDDTMLLDGDVIAIDNLGELSRIEDLGRVPTNLAKPDDDEEQQLDAIDKRGLDGTLFQAAHRASPSLDGGDKSLVGDDDQENGRKNKTSNVARQIKHSDHNEETEEDDDPAWNVQSVDASFADRASALQKTTNAKMNKNTSSSSSINHFDEGEEDDTGNDSPTSVTMRKLVREAELNEENKNNNKKNKKNKGGNLIKSQSGRSIKEMFHISSRRSSKYSNGDGQSVQITNILDPALTLSQNDDIIMDDHHADEDSAISNDSPVGTRSRSDSFVAEDRSVELEHTGPGAAPIWSMEMLDMDSEAPSLSDEQPPKMMSDDVLNITDDTNEDADNDGDNDDFATGRVSRYTVDNMVPFALDESFIPTSTSPVKLNDTDCTAEETADDPGPSNVIDDDNKTMATQEDYEITLDRYRSDVASMAELSRDHPRLPQDAEDCSTVASSAARFGIGAVLGRTRSSSRGRSLSRGRSSSRGQSLTKSVRSLSRSRSLGRSRSRSRGRGRTPSQGCSSDASMDGNNGVLGAIGFSSTASVGTTSRKSAKTTATPTATSTTEVDSCVGLDQVSSLLDQIYGPSTTRQRSELRANKVLQKYQGNEELLLEVLQEKVQAKERSTANDPTASSYGMPAPVAATSTTITANGSTSVEDCDMEGATEADAEAIRSIHGSHTPRPLDAGIELVVDFSHEATESVAAASTSPTADSNSPSKKKRGIVSRGIRKVSKKVGVSRTEKMTQAEEPEEENNNLWVPPNFTVPTNVDATAAANEIPSSNENKAKVVSESANEAPTNYYFQQHREHADISSVKADSAHVTSHETTSFDANQTLDGASTNQDERSGAGYKWIEDDDVAFEIDRGLTVRQRSLTDDNIAPVVIAELAGLGEDPEQYLDSKDMNAPIESDGHLLSSRGTGMSKKTRSKLRLPSIRKQKYVVMEAL